MAMNPVSPVPQQQPRTNVIIWILVVIGAGAVLLVIIGLATAAYIARHIQERDNGKSVEITSPAAQLKVTTTATHETGLPVYPGATSMEGDGAVFEFEPAEGGRLGLAAAQYFTTDSLDDVASWYAQKLGRTFWRKDPGSSIDGIQTVRGENADLAFVCNENGLVRFVALKKRPKGTEIGLVRMGKQDVP